MKKHTTEQLTEVFTKVLTWWNYNPETGKITDRDGRGKAFSNKHGYQELKVPNVGRIDAGSLAYFAVTGKVSWGCNYINGKRGDLRFENLEPKLKRPTPTIVRH